MQKGKYERKKQLGSENYRFHKERYVLRGQNDNQDLRSRSRSHRTTLSCEVRGFTGLETKVKEPILTK